MAILIILIGCSKDAPSPTDETIDKGHDNPDKIEFIFTKMTKNGDDFSFTDVTQKRIYQMNGVAGVQPQGDAIVWEAGQHYHLEIIYYNKAGERMNGEFVTAEMAPIHQHFFTLKGKKAEEMDEVLDYVYRDTNPEEGTLGQDGVTLRKRSWDKNNPDAIDPIGLKGIFSVKKGAEAVELQVTLAHFLGAERGFNKLRNGEVQKYNRLPLSNFFASDATVVIPIEIEEEHHHEADFHKVEFIFTEGHTHGKSFHGDAKYEGVKYLVNQQKISYELTDGKWKPSGATVIRWRQSSYYGLEIVYYNEKNERINSEYIEQAASHQHFFQFENVKAIKTGSVPSNETQIATYLYRDTDPENKYYKRGSNVKLLDNPVGLKGYFHVQQNYLAFDLKVTLAHFISGDKKLNGKYRESTELPSTQLAGREFQAVIPIRIYTDRLSNEEVTITDMMDEFKITREEADKELETKLEAEIDTESSQVWM